ncbi:MAG: NADAR family protein [Blautia sp.]|nr:NADAR family protein [Blautia sp.]
MIDLKEKNKSVMAPPWIAFPEIERYSIGWRMGYGESYIYKWGEWFRSLSNEDMKAYQELFPEPVTWSGYWEDEDECDYYERNEFLLELWRVQGTPKYSLEQIRTEVSEGTQPHYIMFWKPDISPDESVTKSCFSQWWKSDFWSENHTYNCMEQFMMANKAKLFGDEKTREHILQCSDPKTMKALGRKVKNFDEMVWNEVKYSIVLNGNYLKFTQDAKLRNFLLSTGDSVLVEASPYDSIWGIKMRETDENSLNPSKWRGQNLLGFALMEVRDEIRRVWNNANICEPVNMTLGDFWKSL